MFLQEKKDERLLKEIIEMANIFEKIAPGNALDTEVVVFFVSGSEKIKVYSSKKDRDDKELQLNSNQPITKIKDYLSENDYAYIYDDLHVKIKDSQVFIGVRYKQDISDEKLLKFIFDASCKAIYKKFQDKEINTNDVIFGPEEIVRHAAFKYAHSITGLRFAKVDSISRLSHEGKYSHGCIAIINPDNDDINKVDIEFDTPEYFYHIEDSKIRKWLEMTTKDFCLVLAKSSRTFQTLALGKVTIPDYRVLGIGKVNDFLNSYFIYYDGFMKWNLIQKENILLSFANGHPVFKRKTAVNKSFLKECLEIDEENASAIEKIIVQAQGQDHGTMLIFCNEAAIEVDRLVKMCRGIKIKPLDLNENIEVITKITSIDGAIFIDLNGICYGIGMIVDGEAIIPGDPGRGSRYNSANNYVEIKKNQGYRCIACVISEDKTLDILPQEPIKDDNKTNLLVHALNNTIII